MRGLRRRTASSAGLLLMAVVFSACATPKPRTAPPPPAPPPTAKPPPSAPAPEKPRQTLEVTATAYNSVRSQTNTQPTLAAWGDRLVPGMKAIAVSRDLIEMGLGHGTLVEIDGLAGEYVVLDKMHRRWRRKIDIYMGEDVEAARQWGRRKVVIRW